MQGRAWRRCYPPGAGIAPRSDTPRVSRRCLPRGLVLLAAICELEAHPVFGVELERGGVGLSRLALEAFHLPGAALCKELFGLAFAQALAGDLFPDREVAPRLLPRRATVGLLRLDDGGAALGAGPERLAAAGGSGKLLAFHAADLIDELRGKAVYVRHKVGAALRALLHLRETFLPTGRKLG